MFGPSRAGSCSAPPQNANEACGSSTHAPSVTAAAVPTAVAASFQRRVTRKCTTKTPGVSLTAMARPTSTPRGTHRMTPGRGSRRSIRHASTMNAFTWPNRMPSLTGCSHSIGAVSRASARGAHEPAREMSR